MVIKKISLAKIMKKGRAMYLAYDQGMEHGPADFDDENVDPLDIIRIAKDGKFNALIVQKGVARKYNKEILSSRIPLIVKLNGKTNLTKGEPLSRQLCTVKEAVSLGAVAVGFTVYIGSAHENIMLMEFENIVREAHKIGIPVIVWVYPRGAGIKGRSGAELMAYAARFGLETGADMVKINYNGNKKDLAWAVKSAGRCKVVVAGGSKRSEKELLKRTKEIISVGAAGLAIGRNVWQSDNPLKISKELKKEVFVK